MKYVIVYPVSPTKNRIIMTDNKNSIGMCLEFFQGLSPREIYQILSETFDEHYQK